MTNLAKKILVTGANGFIGSYVARRLVSEGHNAICLVRNGGDLSLISDLDHKISIVHGDIRDVPHMYELAADVDCIIHAAAEVSFSAGKTQLLSAAKDGTANMVNAALEAGIPKFVHISSVAAIGRRKPEEQISEKQIFSHSKYDTDYGLAKFLAEQEVWRAHAEGLNTTVINPSMVVGAGLWERTSIRIFAEIYRGLRFYPVGVTGWVDVRDVATAAFKALDPDLNGRRFIISSENLTYKEVFEAIANGLGVKVPSMAIRPGMFMPVVLFDRIKSALQGQKPLLGMASLRSTSACSYFENDLSVTDLHMKYRPVRESIQQACELFHSSFPKGKKYAVLAV